jgi:choline monooxygenase
MSLQFLKHCTPRTTTLLPHSLPHSLTHSLRPLSTLTHSLPAHAYTSPKLHHIDKQHLLGPSWQLLTHESLLLQDSHKGPATFVSDSVSGFPTIVVRSSKTGELNAYHNICRHKAGPLEWSDTRGVCPLNGLKCKVSE